MVDWHAPKEIANDAAAFNWFMHVLLGLFSWDFVLSLKFDWYYLTGRRRFQWRLAFYFANRYTLLASLFGSLSLSTSQADWTVKRYLP